MDYPMYNKPRNRAFSLFLTVATVAIVVLVAGDKIQKNIPDIIDWVIGTGPSDVVAAAKAKEKDLVDEALKRVATLETQIAVLKKKAAKKDNGGNVATADKAPKTKAKTTVPVPTPAPVPKKKSSRRNVAKSGPLPLTPLNRTARINRNDAGIDAGVAANTQAGGKYGVADDSEVRVQALRQRLAQMGDRYRRHIVSGE